MEYHNYSEVKGKKKKKKRKKSLKANTWILTWGESLKENVVLVSSNLQIPTISNQTQQREIVPEQ